MKIKKFLAALLSLLTIVSFFCMRNASAAGISDSDGFRYQNIGSTTDAEVLGLTPNGGLENESEITIPSQLGGFPVISIARSAFFGNTVQQKINLPGSLRVISPTAFANSAITEIAIPFRVTNIGDSAFANCTSLYTVNFQGIKLQVLPRNAFFGCTSLTNLVLPENLNRIEEAAFANCTALNNIYIPQSTNYISSSAFTGVTNLTVYGKAGTYAKTFAEQNGYDFVEYGKVDDGAFYQWMYVAEGVLNGDTSAYTPDSIAALQEAYNDGANARADFFVNQETIDTATENLKTAYRALKTVNAPALAEKIAQANALLEQVDLYTQQSVENLQTALSAADKAYSATPQKPANIEKAIAQLDSSISALTLQSRVDLQALVDKANQILENDADLYVKTSVVSLSVAVQDAQKALDNENSTDSEYKLRITVLQAALDKLILKSYSTLQNNIIKCEKLLSTEEYKYTEESVAALNAEIESAKNILNDKSATNDDYVNANESLSTAYSALTKVLIGDVSLDGKLSLADVVIMLRAEVGTQTLTQRQAYAADVNGDGTQKLDDAVQLQRIILEMD